MNSSPEDNESDNEIEFLSSESVSNKFYGEDLCERAAIQRRNAKTGTDGSVVPLNDYNESYINLMLKKDTNNETDYEIQSILNTIGRHPNYLFVRHIR